MQKQRLLWIDLVRLLAILMLIIGVPIGLQIPCGAMLVFAVSWALTALILRLTGRAGKYIMG